MLVIPAIDLFDGMCVRLKQGRFEDVTVYSKYPEEIAMSFEQDGAELIHIVDLNGALKGEPTNFKKIEKIVKSINIPVEVGGGIRDIDKAKTYINLGVKRIIIGTKGCESPEYFEEICKSVKAEVIAGIDAKDGKVAVKGWIDLTNWDALDLALELERRGAKEVIYTDITKDGMRTGPNIDATLKIAKKLSIPVIVSGGISSEEDIISILPYNKFGIKGVIVGRAIYEGNVNLKKLIKKLTELSLC
ncbi:MAG: 1-(5-phosphoribosyl)-5-[(5-phosphoribosylamino)methylideneamino]imidazole-4-carboxamide isomerase [Proteobacteria bacterium]|nr:1-(5-phosphoribosyl)-5-[(5-phosphoribosylamino)methylideneamino]imidazole-4-carboxamide isomerase [Pseudomonadota bacterium]